MKIVEVRTLISKGAFATSAEWQNIQKMAYDAINAVVWPPGSNIFTIHPQSGKKRGEGNGVKPIKDAAISYLVEKGWKADFPWPVGTQKSPGNIDAAYQSTRGLVGFEWETGNISSSHRSLNKLSLGLLHGKTIGGFLVVPSRKLYRYLTDRVGNIAELEPYLDVWSNINCDEGTLEIIVIEHDAESVDVPRIGKGTDGRNLL